MIRPTARACVAWALIATLLFIAWQFLTVTRNYKGNWTALFCLGDHVRVPPGIARGAWIFRNSDGYDGQFYRDVAHDPWLRGEAHRFLDDPALRSRRILVPALAWILAFGNDSAVDWTYLIVIWSFVFAGCCWTALDARHCGLSPAWALLFLLVPATLISMDRLTVDVSTVALTAGFRYCYQRRDAAVYAICAAACLSRETGALLVVALVADCLLRRNWKRAGIFASSSAYAVLWYIYVHARTSPSQRRSAFHWFFIHNGGPLYRILHPMSYSLPAAMEKMTQVVDEIALFGVVASFAVGIILWRRNRSAAPNIALLLFGLSFVALMARRFWDSVYGYARPLSPLQVLTGSEAMREKPGPRLRWFIPWAMIDLRIFLQLAPQLIGIVQGGAMPY